MPVHLRGLSPAREGRHCEDSQLRPTAREDSGAVNPSETRQVVRVASNVLEHCAFCDAGAAFGLSEDGTTFLVEQVNHLISVHGFRVLHVGQESDWTSEGEIAQHTVAVLGTDRPVAEFDRSAVQHELNRILDMPPSLSGDS